MKEFSFQIEPTGLKAEPSAMDGAALLKNLKPEKGFWSVPVLPVFPDEWNPTTQVFRAQTQTVLCASSKIYLVDETDLSPTEVAAVTPGGIWQMADFGPVWMLTNGTSVVYRVPGLDDGEEEGDGDGYVNGVKTNPVYGAICAHYGSRLVYGNCGLGQNWVGWSTVDGQDIPYILAGTALPAKLAALNEANAAPMPWRGKVLAVVPLRDKIIVYGEDGVTALSVRGGSYSFDWLIGLPSGVGVSGRGSVAGTDEGHVFVGTDGGLYAIGPDLSATRVNLGAVAVGDRVVYEPTRREWWISGASTSHVLTASGLGGPIDARLLSIVMLNGVPLATGRGYPDDDIRAEIWSNRLDAGDDGQKRITFVRVSGDNLSRLRAGIKGCVKTNAAMQQSPWTPCSPEGFGFVNRNIVSGHAGVLAQVVPGSRIWRVEVRYQAHDRRSIRGTRGFPQNEQ